MTGYKTERQEQERAYSPGSRQKIIEKTMVRMDKYEKIRQENRKKIDQFIKTQYPYKPTLMSKQGA